MIFEHQDLKGDKKTSLILAPTYNASEDEIELFYDLKNATVVKECRKDVIRNYA